MEESRDLLALLSSNALSEVSFALPLAAVLIFVTIRSQSMCWQQPGTSSQRSRDGQPCPTQRLSCSRSKW